MDLDAAGEPDRRDKCRDDHPGQRSPDDRPDHHRDTEDEDRPTGQQATRMPVRVERVGDVHARLADGEELVDGDAGGEREHDQHDEDRDHAGDVPAPA